MSIYVFKPTWLYIKQHNQTGLKYFGKTVRKDPVKYKGSGVRWSSHLKKYGNDTTTLWYQLFTDEVSLIEYATKFSIDNKIVESVGWANLTIENGIGGGHGFGVLLTEETKRKISETKKNSKPPWNKGLKLGPLPDAIKQKISKTQSGAANPMYGKHHTAEAKAKMTGRKKST